MRVKTFGMHQMAWAFTILLCLFLFLPFMFGEGLFMDGMMYTNIAHNLYSGEGTFWQPYFLKTIYPAFHEHPPLAFGLQSLWYHMFGNHIWVDKFFPFCMAIFTGSLMVLIWRKLFEDSKTMQVWSWLPILLWISIPRVFWAYQNNVLECTMGVFCGLAILSLLFVDVKLHIKSLGLMLMSAIFLLLAFLTKGFTGLFPLAALFFIDLILRKYPLKVSIIRSLMLLGIFLAVILLFFGINSAARDNIAEYLNTQVAQSLSGQRETDSRLFIIKTLISESLLPIVLTILVVLIYRFRFKKTINSTIFTKQSLVLFTIGLSGILPIMVSPKQLGFYIVPAVPYFVMGLMALVLPILHQFQIKPKMMLLRAVSVFVLFGFIALPIIAIQNAGKPTRDHAELSDMHKIAQIVGQKTSIDASPELFRNWTLMAYFKRYEGIELDFFVQNNRYLIIKVSEVEWDHYHDTGLKLEKYRLLEAD